MVLSTRKQTSRKLTDPRTGEKGSANLVWAILLIVLALLIGIVLYLVYDRDWRTSPVNEREVKQVLASVEGVSENAVITSKVKAALALSKNVSAADIHVDTDRGVVTLRGRVLSPEVRQLAGEIAQDTTGVRQVKNELTVEEAAQPPDVLAKQVEFELFSSGAFDLSAIQVHSKDGVVVLQGQVRSIAEKLLAEKLAQGVDGVKNVQNELSIRSVTKTQSAE